MALAPNHDWLAVKLGAGRLLLVLEHALGAGALVRDERLAVGGIRDDVEVEPAAAEEVLDGGVRGVAEGVGPALVRVAGGWELAVSGERRAEQAQRAERASTLVNRAR